MCGKCDAVKRSRGQRCIRLQYVAYCKHWEEEWGDCCEQSTHSSAEMRIEDCAYAQSPKEVEDFDFCGEEED